MSAPLLAAVTLRGRGDGIAVVADLLRGAMVSGWGRDCRVATMFDGAAFVPGLADKVRFAARLGRELIVGRPAWLLANHLGLLKALGGVPASLRPPYAVFLHGIEAWRPLSGPEARRVSAARVRLANSHYTARRAQAANPGLGAIAVCPLALPDGRQPRPPASGTQAPEIGDHAVLAVGRMASAERYKGHDALLAAWPRVLARVPSAQLIFAGGGDDVERLRRAAAEPALRGSVRVLGFVPDDDLELLYRRAACFALPSTGEGFGLVYLEAMARGLPCLALRDSAAAEIVLDGVTGCLADAQDEDSLATALIGLLEHPERRKGMGAAGLERVSREFSRASFERRAIQVLSDAFGTPARSVA